MLSQTNQPGSDQVAVTANTASSLSATGPTDAAGNPIGSNGNPIDEIVVTAARTGSLVGVPFDFTIPFPQEQLWVGYGPNDIRYVGINGQKQGNVGRNSAMVPKGYQFIIHTHPSWADPTPGPGDYGQSVPIYGITPDNAWVVLPGATAPTVIYTVPVN